MSDIISVRPLIRLETPLAGSTARHEMPLGTAEWFQADGRVIRPFRPGDFFLGRAPGGEAVGFNDNRHVLICSGTRGGKGTSVIIPNLVTWPGSTVVIDPKGENAMVTARRRANGSEFCAGMGQKVCILDPFNIVNTPQDDFSDLKVSFNPMAMLSVSYDQRRTINLTETFGTSERLHALHSPPCQSGKPNSNGARVL